LLCHDNSPPAQSFPFYPRAGGYRIHWMLRRRIDCFRQIEIGDLAPIYILGGSTVRREIGPQTQVVNFGPSLGRTTAQLQCSRRPLLHASSDQDRTASTAVIKWTDMKTLPELKHVAPRPRLPWESNVRPRISQIRKAAGSQQRVPQNAQRNYERYLALARAEALAGDRIAAENYFQHAEHYFRSMHQNSH
jgi:Domain of unknown function (DUF4167)